MPPPNAGRPSTSGRHCNTEKPLKSAAWDGLLHEHALWTLLLFGMHKQYLSHVKAAGGKSKATMCNSTALLNTAGHCGWQRMGGRCLWTGAGT